MNKNGKVASNSEPGSVGKLDQTEDSLQKGLKILVVEDDEVNRIVTSRLLERKGYVVETAANGQKALALLGNDIFDLVLMDIFMPKIDGLALAKKIKKNSKTKNIPVVAVTVYVSEEDKERLLAEGMDGFVAKPVKPEELFKVIMQLTSESCDAVDREGLILRTDGDRDFIREVEELFCQTSRKIIDEINNSDDFQTVDDLAHKLQGAAETAGARQIIDIANRIKLAAKAGEREIISSACQSFLPALDIFKKSLLEWGIILSDTEIG